MKDILKQIAQDNNHHKNSTVETLQGETISPVPKNGRRNFFKKTALGGISLAGMMSLSVEDSIAETTSKVQRYSNPSDLKITV